MSAIPPSKFNPYQASSSAYSQAYAEAVPLRHSGLGIASFAVAVLGGAAAIMLIVAVTLVEEESPLMTALGFGLLGAIGLHLAGLVLGVVALFPADRKKVFAVLGILFNLALLLGICGLLAFGLMIASVAMA